MHHRSVRTACLITLLAALPFAAPACRPRTSDTENRPEVQAYLAKLQEWRRDSAVIDSLSRLVDTDSLLQIQRAELRADRVDRISMQAMMCETFRLHRRHGTRPLDVAMARLDSAFTPEERRRYRRISLSAPAGFYRADSAVCGPPPGGQAPDSVHGISLTESKLRPWHPDSLPSPFRP